MPLKQSDFMRLYRPVHENFSRYVMAMVRDEERARDLISQTVLEAYESFHTLRDENRFLPFLITISRRLFSRELQRDSKIAKLSTAYDQRTDASQDPEAWADLQLLYGLLQDLPSDGREALILYEINGLSYQEIQEIQGDSLSAVKSRISRAREKLREWLQPEAYISKNGKS